MSETTPRPQQFPCPSCGASLEFRPSLSALVCPFCGHSEKAKTPRQPTATTSRSRNPFKRFQHSEPTPLSAVQERDYETFAQQQPALAQLSDSALEVQCNGCQANITFEPPETAGNCPFCATPIVAEPQEAHPLLMPESLLPFRLGKRESQKAIAQWISNRWFAPNELKQLAQPELIQGVYVPFWTFDAQTHSRYTGERGVERCETKTRTVTNAEGERETEEYEECHTDWYRASGKVHRFFDDVLIPGVEGSVKPKRLSELEPWPLKELVPYEASYLAGFKVQRYQVNVQQGLAKAREEMAKKIRCDVERDIGGDEQRIHSVDTKYSAVTFKHILLPVWISAYRYQNKQYQVVVNAQTGEVLGDRPYSWVKIAIAVLAAASLILIIVLLT